MPCDRHGPCIGVITGFTIIPKHMPRPFVVDSLTKRLRSLTPYSRPQAATPNPSPLIQAQALPPLYMVPPTTPSTGLEVDYTSVSHVSTTPTGCPLDRNGVYIVQRDSKTSLFAKPKCEFGRPKSRGQNLEKVLRWTSATYKSVQKTVSDLALRGENRIPAVPCSQQEASTIKRIVDSATEAHPLLLSYVDQWPARAMLQLICSNHTSRAAGKRGASRGQSVPPPPSTGLSRTQSRSSSLGPSAEARRTSTRSKKTVRIETP